jgi:hypothetical protein
MSDFFKILFFCVVGACVLYYELWCIGVIQFVPFKIVFGLVPLVIAYRLAKIEVRRREELGHVYDVPREVSEESSSSALDYLVEHWNNGS